MSKRRPSQDLGNVLYRVSGNRKVDGLRLAPLLGQSEVTPLRFALESRQTPITQQRGVASAFAV